MTHPKSILVVLPSPLGDAILAGPALRRLRHLLAGSRITWLGNPTTAAILAGAPWADEILALPSEQLRGRRLWRTARGLGQFDAAILMPNSWRAALLAWAAGCRQRIGYDRGGRGPLLTCGVMPVRRAGGFAPLSMLDYYGHLIDRAAARLGANAGCYLDDDQALELFVNQDDEAAAARALAPLSAPQRERLAILVPGGAFGGSKWWPTERFAALADRLHEELGLTAALSIAPNDTERRLAASIKQRVRHDVLDLHDAGLTLGGLKAVMRSSRLVVSNDTGPCHIAAAFRRPLVTLFGPTDPRWTATDYDGEARLRATVDCGPCQTSVCTRDHACMRSLSVDDVLAAAQELLQNETPGRTTAKYYAAYDERYAPLPDGAGLVHVGWRRCLCQAGMSDMAGVMALRGDERLDKPGLRGRERLSVAVTGPDARPHTLYVKRFPRPRWTTVLRRLQTRRDDATAAADFWGAVTLGELGLWGPRPLFFGRQGGRWREQHSAVILAALPDEAVSLERLAAGRVDGQGYELWSYPVVLMQHIGQLARRLHEAGWFHRDFYLAHLFITTGPAPAACEGSPPRRDTGNKAARVCLIDLQRLFQPHWRHQRWRVKDLGQLLYSAETAFPAEAWAAFWRAYFDADQINNAQQRLITAAQAKARRIARHDQRQQRRREGRT